MVALILIDTGIWKNSSQKRIQGLTKPKAYINPTPSIWSM